MILHHTQYDYLLLPPEDLYYHLLPDGVFAGEISVSTRGWRREAPYAVWARMESDGENTAAEVSIWQASEHTGPALPLTAAEGWQRLGEIDIPAGMVQIRVTAPGASDGRETRPNVAVLLTGDQGFVPGPDIKTKADLAAIFSDPTGTSRIEPASATAGTWRQLVITFTAGEQGIDAGGRISAGVIPFAWSAPHTLDPAAAGYTTVVARHVDGRAARVEVESVEKSADPDFDREVWLPIVARERLGPGATIAITYGDQSAGGPGTFVPSVPLRYDCNEKYAWYWHMPPLTIWVDAHGNGVQVPLASGHFHTFDVVPAIPERLRVIAPSTVAPGERFTVRVAAVDRFRNVCSSVQLGDVRVTTPGAGVTVLEPAERPLRGGGWMRLEASVAADGLHRLMLEDPASGLRGESNPIRCAVEASARVFWGDFHVHCDFSDGVRTIEHLYDYGEQVAGLDVCGASDHSPMMTDTMWARNVELVRERYRPGRFVTLLGFEWAAPGTGHRCVYSRDDELTLERVRTLSGLRERLDHQRASGREVLVIPHHMLASTATYAPERPDIERLMEVYSQWGNSEVRGNPKRPLSHWDSNTEDRGRSAQEILLAGGRLGMVGGSDNHDARPGMTGAGAHDIVGLRVRSIYRTLGHPGGLAGIYAPNLTREAVFDGLAARHCYATTGERILVEFAVDGAPMGSEIAVPHTQAPPTVTAWVAGTAPIRRLVVLRNAIEAHEVVPDGDAREAGLSWEDTAPVSEQVMFYYLRVEQADGEVAWSSPVWLVRKDQDETTEGHR
jgi:hypothetical protein